MPIDPGTTIGPYKVLDSLGAGGMGEVYLARDTRLGRKIALKFLSADYTKDEDRVRRFQQEARAASALNHPNLITIFEIGEVNSVHFISTEFIEGETLRRRLTKRLSNTEIFEVAIQVGSALATAHAAGITHRDIKPENIMVRPDGVVKVLDFGLAKLTEPTDPGASIIDPGALTKRVVDTSPGVVMGTVSYMSPEQARGLTVDARTDIFSFGVVLYEMTAGRVPFEGTSFGDVISGILGKKPVPIARYSPDVPAELERIIAKALAKDREERYQSIKELLIDLKRLKQRLDVEAEIEHSAPPDWARDPVMGRSGEARSGSDQTITLGASSQSVRTTSSAEYLVSEIKRHKKATFFVLAAAVIAAVAITFVSTRRPIDSIAILPFANQTGDAKMEAIGDEMTEGIINHLYELQKLKVISYGSVVPYKGRPLDPQAIGKELGVSAVMVGRLTKSDDDGITVNAELVDVRDRSRIWGGEPQKFKFSDLMLAHHKLARSVLGKLGLSFSDKERKELEAEELYENGRNYWGQRTTDALNKGIESFEKAVALKPDYALAHAGLADCYNMLATYGAKPPAEAFPKAKAEALKALDIDDKMAEAHTSLAYALFRGDWKWAASESQFKQALRLNSKSAQAHQWYANLLVALGRDDEAIAQTKQAQELDSTSLIIRSQFGFVYFFQHRYDDAIAECQKVLELDRRFFPAHRYLGQNYGQKGKYDQAISEFQRAVSANGSPQMRAELAYTYGRAGKKDEAQKILTALQDPSAEGYISPYGIALIYSGLGNKEETFNWLERGLQERADYLVFLKVDPRFDWLHGDPRFNSLLERIGLP